MGWTEMVRDRFRQGLRHSKLNRWSGMMALFLLLALLVTACGSTVPKEIVNQALTYRIAHPSSRPLVGYDQVQQQLQLLKVQVHSDQTQEVLLTNATLVSAHHLQGTYDIKIQPTPSRHYRRNHLPFQLTLADPDPESAEWILLEPVPRTDPQQWRPLSFLPPAPPPPAEPEETPEPETSEAPVTDRGEEAAQDLGEGEETPLPLTVTDTSEEMPVPMPTEAPSSLSEGNG